MKTSPSRFTSILLAASLGISFAGSIQAADKVNFEKEIWPIIKESCLKCHKAPYEDERGRMKNPKADLRLDTAELIMKGGEDGKVIVPGKPNESPFYKLTTLDPDSDDIMPPKGDPLTKAQTELIRKWIEEGADFGGWKSGSDEGAAVSPKTQKAPDLIEALGKGLAPAPEKAMAPFKEIGALVMAISQKNNLLRVDCSLVADKVTDETLAALAPLADHLTDLNLAGSKISDAGLKAVAACSKLTRLHLEKTAITDAGIDALSSLSNLQYLNLYNTAVGDQGVAKLSGNRNLSKLYLWQTKVTDDGAMALQKEMPSLMISRGWAIERKPVSDKAIIAGFIEGRCCDKALKDGTVCSRTCCLKAVAAGQACSECNKPKSAEDLAYDKLAADFDAGSCCGKAHAAGNKCDHECCEKAAAANKICFKCNKEAKARLGGSAEEDQEEVAAVFVAGSCCDKAHKAGKACSHPCCKKAYGEGKVCAKCNKSSDDDEDDEKEDKDDKEDEDEDKEDASDLSDQFKAGSCCDKANKAGKECSHGCCVKAAKDNKVCEKCNS
jgi:hypothetical protein